MLLAAAVVLAVRYRRRVPRILRNVRLSHLITGVVLGALNCLPIVSLDLATVAFVVVATAGSLAGVGVMASGTLIGCTVVLLGAGFDAGGRDALIGIFAGSVLLGFPLALFNVGQRVVPASETALLLMGEVVLAPIWVWWFVDERPEPTTLIGGAIVLVAVAWLTVVRTPRGARLVTSRG